MTRVAGLRKKLAGAQLDFGWLLALPDTTVPIDAPGDHTIYSTDLVDGPVSSELPRAAATGDWADIVGTPGDDILEGTDGNDNIHGADGNDRLFGRGGSDYITGWIGDDFLYGEGGDDNLLGGAGNDRLDGGDGFDWATYDDATGSVTVSLAIAGAQNTGSAGMDTLVNIEAISGSNFNDVLTGNAAEYNHLGGGGGNDKLYGGEGRDGLFGGDDHDELYGGDGQDYLTGEDGDDTLDGGAGDDFIDGGAGDDTASYATATGAVSVDLSVIDAQDTQGAGFDALVSIENLIGSAFGDTLKGNDGANRIEGGAGNDKLYGGGGDDFLGGGADDDVLDGINPIVDGVGPRDFLDGGVGRDLFLVDAGDTIKQFTAEDDAILFYTARPLSHFQMIQANGLTAVRVWSSDLTSHDDFAIQSGMDLREIAVTVGNAEGYTGLKLTPGTAPTSLLDGFTVDPAGARDAIQKEVGDHWSQLPGTALEDAINAAKDWVLEDGNIKDVLDKFIKNKTLIKSIEIVLQKFNPFFVAIDRFEFGYAIGTYINDAFVDRLFWGDDSKYWNADGSINYNEHIKAITDIIASQVTFGPTLVVLGNALIEELSKITLDSIRAALETTGQEVQQIRNNPTPTPPTDNPDLIIQLPGLTSYQGGGGDDVLVASAGAPAARPDSKALQAEATDSFDGGAGSDTIFYNSATGPVVVDLDAGTASSAEFGNDALIGIENAFTGAGDDALLGNALANEFNGGDGDDLLDGRGGLDRLFGGAGNDRLVVSTAGSGTSVDGGADSDTLVVSGTVTLGTLAGLEAIELVGGGTLTLTAAQFNTGFLNPISQIGAASVSGSGSLVFNLDPNPVASVLALTGLTFAGGSSVTVTINGSNGIDVIKGAVAVTNTINGGDGTDQIRGGNQADTINGGIGNDKLFGWGGGDTLTGGAGSDQFRYFFATDSGIGAAADRITDFEIGIDRFNFTLIDTNPGLAGVQGFTFLGTAAFTAPGTGQIRYLTSGSDLIVQADVNGDGAADMEVVLQGLAGQTLTSAEFMLGTPPPVQEPLSAKDATPQVMDPLLDAAKLPAEGLAASEPLLTVSFVDPLDFPDHGLMRWGTPHSDWLPLG